jgi:hypothetical protein
MARLVYHWKHGWIPLDHAAALSKAHGSEHGAAKWLSATSAHAQPHELKPGDHAKVQGRDHLGQPITLTGRVVGNTPAHHPKTGAPLRAISLEREGASGMNRVDPVYVPDPKGVARKRKSNAQALAEARAVSVPSPVGKDARTMTSAQKIKAAEIMFGTGSKQHQAAKKKFGAK